uniref:Uncharacterized protein n=1 Tax=Daphnia magna TaxID=35525 RepID=A0A0P6FC87_9CRUS
MGAPAAGNFQTAIESEGSICSFVSLTAAGSTRVCPFNTNVGSKNEPIRFAPVLPPIGYL